MNKRPAAGEYPEYFAPYIQLVSDGDVRTIMKEDLTEIVAQLRGIPEDKADYRYAPQKWSLKEVVGHMADTERVMTYRLLRVARGDRTPLAGFDENMFIAGADFGRLPLGELIDEFAVVRDASIRLAAGLSEEAWGRSGIVSGHEMTALALAYVAVGHARHHRNIILSKYLELH